METLDLLTENTHYEAEEFYVGRWTGSRYCYFVRDGCAKTLRITHPDVDTTIIERKGKQLAKELQGARNQTKKLEVRRRLG